MNNTTGEITFEEIEASWDGGSDLKIRTGGSKKVRNNQSASFP